METTIRDDLGSLQQPGVTNGGPHEELPPAHSSNKGCPQNNLSPQSGILTKLFDLGLNNCTPHYTAKYIHFFTNTALHYWIWLHVAFMKNIVNPNLRKKRTICQKNTLRYKIKPFPQEQVFKKNIFQMRYLSREFFLWNSHFSAQCVIKNPQYMTFFLARLPSKIL